MAASSVTSAGIYSSRITKINIWGVLLAGVGFAADTALEQGVASGVFYVAVVALTTRMPGLGSTLGAGVAASALTLLGYFVSPPGGELWHAVANRFFALFAIWVAVATVWHHKRQGARRDLAEKRAARSELQFRQTIEASPTGMLLVDAHGRIALANHEVERLFGFTRHELLGQFVEVLVPELERSAHAARRAVFAAEPVRRRMSAGREISGIDKQGRTLLLEIGLARLETADGEFVLATVTDAGVRKQLESARGTRALARALLMAEEAYRKRMAREIHDALGQALTALKLDIGWLAAHLPDEPAQLHNRIMEMGDLASRTLMDARRLSMELRPVILDDHGLLAAIRWQVVDFEKHSGLHVSLTLPDNEIPWGSERDTAAFRVLQEALTNVARHARARNISVALSQHQHYVFLEVRDDGRGISEAEAARPDALGLLGMRERALLHDGVLTVAGVEGVGTTVTLRMPCETGLLPNVAAPGTDLDPAALHALVAGT